jgi:hypothetical protein
MDESTQSNSSSKRAKVQKNLIFVSNSHFLFFCLDLRIRSRKLEDNPECNPFQFGMAFSDACIQ